MSTGFLITARLKSTRLRKKVLLDLNGRPILEHIISKCSSIIGPDKVVICTSDDPQDDPLCDLARRNLVHCYRGPREDVLKRLLQAALAHGLDSFLSITADNPLFSAEIANLILEYNEKDRPDFVFTGGLPSGIAPYFINTKALDVACHKKIGEKTEIWGPYVNRPDFFTITELHCMNSPFNESKRLTCDYPEDYKLIRLIYKELGQEGAPGLWEVFRLLQNKPELWEINEMHRQRLLSSSLILEINQEFDRVRSSKLAYAGKIGKSLKPRLHKYEINI